MLHDILQQVHFTVLFVNEPIGVTSWTTPPSSPYDVSSDYFSGSALSGFLELEKPVIEHHQAAGLSDYILFLFKV